MSRISPVESIVFTVCFGGKFGQLGRHRQGAQLLGVPDFLGNSALFSWFPAL